MKIQPQTKLYLTNQVVSSANSKSEQVHLPTSRPHQLQPQRHHQNSFYNLVKLAVLGSLVFHRVDSFAVKTITARWPSQAPKHLNSMSMQQRLSATLAGSKTPLSDGPSNNKGYFTEEWQTIAQDWHYLRALSRWENNVAIVEQQGIHKLLHDQGITYLGFDVNDSIAVTEQEVIAFKSAIDLVQLSSGKFNLPLAIVLFRADNTKSQLTEQLTKLFNFEIAQQIIARLTFNASGFPTVLGTDISGVLMPLIANTIYKLGLESEEKTEPTFDNEQSSSPTRNTEITDWMADFDAAAKVYYDVNNNDKTVSTYSWGVFTQLVKAEVLQSVTQDIPKKTFALIVDSDDINLKVLTAAMRLKQQSQTQNNSYQLYSSRLAWSGNFGLDPSETQHLFDTNKPMHLLKTFTGTISITKGTTLDEVRTQLLTLFPDIGDKSILANLENEYTKKSSAASATPIELNLKHCMRLQASILLDELIAQPVIQKHVAFYTAASAPVDTIDKPRPQNGTVWLYPASPPKEIIPEKIAKALNRHFRLCISEAIAEVIYKNNLSPGLATHPKIITFLHDWVDLIQLSTANNMRNYNFKKEALLDKHFLNNKSGRV